MKDINDSRVPQLEAFLLNRRENGSPRVLVFPLTYMDLYVLGTLLPTTAHGTGPEVSPVATAGLGISRSHRI